MKQTKLTWWGHGLIGFFSGLILMFLLMISIIPDYTPIGDPTDLTERDLALVLVPLLILFMFGLSLLVTAWRHKSNRKTMIRYLIPGLILTIFLFIFLFGGVLFIPFM